MERNGEARGPFKTLTQHPDEPRIKKQKPRFLRKRGFGEESLLPRAATNSVRQLLGLRSAGSSSSGCISSSLCSVSSRSCIGGGGSRSCVRGSRSGFRSSRSRSGCRSCCRCRSWCGFFLLATSGESSSSDQGGQNDGVLHFKFPSWTDKKLEKPQRPALKALVRIGAMHLRVAPFSGAAINYIGI